MAVKVLILESFEVVHMLGPLETHEPRTGVVAVIDGPREFRNTYQKGSIAHFNSQSSAEHFCSVHSGRARIHE